MELNFISDRIYFKTMNLVRQLRLQQGLTQQQLASAGGTSQSAIAAYESGAKSPTLRTIDQLAASLGVECVVGFVPRMSREDRRSLAFHRAIAALIEADAPSTIGRAERNLARLNDAHPHAVVLFNRWREWLALSPRQLAARMLDPGLAAREMRQVSPFSGMLSPRARADILREFGRSERQ